MGSVSLCRWPLIYCCSSSSSLPSSRVKLRCCRSSSPQLSLSPVHKTLLQIKNSGVISCLRANSVEMALGAAHATIGGGISALEIVMSTPGVFEILQQLVKEHPTMALGVGTFLRVEDARTAINAGAKFLMSPATVKDILGYALQREILYIPGAMTLTEDVQFQMLSAWDAGAKIVKVYLVSALGGFQYISALRKPFTQIPMVASQGITTEAIGEYIVRGASSVVLSDAIFDKEAIAQYDFKKIYQFAHFAALLGNEVVEWRKNEF